MGRLIPDSCIHIDLPSMRQTRTFACGATVFRAICYHFNVAADQPESYFIERIGTDAAHGTSPADLVRAAKAFKMKAEVKEGMTIAQLKKYLKKGIPVICNVQAWGVPREYDDRLHGHYVAAIGFDDECLYFMDPWLPDGERGYLTNEEFMWRWHGQQDPETPFIQWGMAMWKPSALRKKPRVHKVKKIK